MERSWHQDGEDSRDHGHDRPGPTVVQSSDIHLDFVQVPKLHDAYDAGVVLRVLSGHSQLGRASESVCRI